MSGKIFVLPVVGGKIIPSKKQTQTMFCFFSSGIRYI